jgi:3-deoxy-D-manno-octulosonic-acid transferase
MGPHTFNFAQAAEMAAAAGAARVVADLPEALTQALALSGNNEARDAMANAGLQFSQAHRGAAQRMAAAVGDVLTRRCGTRV